MNVDHPEKKSPFTWKKVWKEGREFTVTLIIGLSLLNIAVFSFLYFYLELDDTHGPDLTNHLPKYEAPDSKDNGLVQLNRAVEPMENDESLYRGLREGYDLVQEVLAHREGATALSRMWPSLAGYMSAPPVLWSEVQQVYVAAFCHHYLEQIEGGLDRALACNRFQVTRKMREGSPFSPDISLLAIDHLAHLLASRAVMRHRSGLYHQAGADWNRLHLLAKKMFQLEYTEDYLTATGFQWASLSIRLSQYLIGRGEYISEYLERIASQMSSPLCDTREYRRNLKDILWSKRWFYRKVVKKTGSEMRGSLSRDLNVVGEVMFSLWGPAFIHSLLKPKRGVRRAWERYEMSCRLGPLGYREGREVFDRWWVGVKVVEKEDGLNRANILDGKSGRSVWEMQKIFYQHQWMERAHQVWLALYRYRQDKGELPENLNLLVPQYLKQIPVDPYTGKAVAYSKEKQMVYSPLHSQLIEEWRDEFLDCEEKTKEECERALEKHLEERQREFRLSLKSK